MIIALNKDYINILTTGEHTLKVTFADGGSAITTFTLASVPEVENPKTLDNISLYIRTGIVSLIGLTGILIYKRKQFN